MMGLIIQPSAALAALLSAAAFGAAFLYLPGHATGRLPA